MIKQKTIENDLEFLRQISREVDFEHDNINEIINELREFCINEPLSMALAAVQLGIPLRILYLKKTDLTRLEENDYNENRILINPKIISALGKTKYWEACASCGDLTGLVERPYKITLSYQNEQGLEKQEIFEGLAATVIAHEIDHFNGTLHIDIASQVRTCTAEERLKLREKEPYKIISKDGIYVYNEKK